VPEFSNAGGTEEGFEAAHTGASERLEIRGVARDDAAPETDVDMTASGRGAPLRVERRDVGGRWDAVERHIDDRRHAARGRRERAGLKSFPVGATRIVDVDVRVDDAGHHDGGARVDQFRRSKGRR
jgi:hypothetical protein